MRFYEELRAFFKKHDPSRIRLAKKIAAVYTTPKAQKAAMNRLREVYAGGGPDSFDFGAKPIAKEAAKAVTEVVEDVVEEEVEEQVQDLDDASDDELQEVAD